MAVLCLELSSEGQRYKLIYFFNRGRKEWNEVTGRGRRNDERG
jgi:hypothetical protein